MNLAELIQRANERLAELGLNNLSDARVADAFTERNVRFLRQSGVLAPPDGYGPGATWTDTHLQQLVTARALQASGKSIVRIAAMIAGLDAAALRKIESSVIASLAVPPPPDPIPPCSAWQLTPDFILVANRRIGLSPAKLNQIKRILANPSNENTNNQG